MPIAKRAESVAGEIGAMKREFVLLMQQYVNAASRGYRNSIGIVPFGENTRLVVLVFFMVL